RIERYAIGCYCCLLLEEISHHPAYAIVTDRVLRLDARLTAGNECINRQGLLHEGVPVVRGNLFDGHRLVHLSHLDASDTWDVFDADPYVRKSNRSACSDICDTCGCCGGPIGVSQDPGSDLI